MQIQISRFALTNIRELGASRADLAQALHSLQEGSLVFASEFPSKSDDLCVVTDRILSHVAAADITSTITSPDLSIPQSISSSNLTRYALWSEPRDVWCLKIDPLWIDFIGARSVGQSKSVPFVDAVPITLWVHGKSSTNPIDIVNIAFFSPLFNNINLLLYFLRGILNHLQALKVPINQLTIILYCLLIIYRRHWMIKHYFRKICITAQIKKPPQLILLLSTQKKQI